MGGSYKQVHAVKRPIFDCLPYKTLRITSKYGDRTHPITGKKSFHYGVDIGPESGDSDLHVVAVQDGTVVEVGKTAARGFYIIIEHDGFSTLYQHLMNNTFVSEGVKVNAGSLIGIMGSTGASTGTHLHFELRDENNTLIDPQWFLENLKEDAMTREEVIELFEELITNRIEINQEPSDYAVTPVNALKESHITTGERPRGLATREEVMVMIFNTLIAINNTYERQS